jgi:hypothetical protein
MGALPMNEGPTFTLPWCIGPELRCGTDDGIIGLAQFALDFPFAVFGGAPGPTHMAARVQIDQRAELSDVDCHFAKTAAGMRRIDIDRVMYWMRGALAFWVLASFCGLGVAVLWVMVYLLILTSLVSSTQRSLTNFKESLSFGRQGGAKSSRLGTLAIGSIFVWAFLPGFIRSDFSGLFWVASSLILTVQVGIILFACSLPHQSAALMAMFCNIVLSASLSIPLVLFGLVQDWENAVNPGVRVALGVAYIYRIYRTPVKDGRIEPSYADPACQRLLEMRYNLLVYGILRVSSDEKYSPTLVFKSKYRNHIIKPGGRAAVMYIEPVLWLLFVLALQSLTDRVEAYTSTIWSAVVTLSVISIRLWPQLHETWERDRFIEQCRNAVGFSGIGIGLSGTDYRRARLDSLNIDSGIVYRIDEGLLSQFGLGRRPEY